MQFIAILLALTTAVQAVPFYEKLDARWGWGWNRGHQRFCNKVIEVISIFNEQAQATSFCSGYLNIPLSTATATVTSFTTTVTKVVTSGAGTTTVTAATATVDTSTTVTAAPVTVTCTQSSTVTTTSTSTVVNNIQSCAPPTTSTYAPNPKLAKRWGGNRKNPQCFSTYAEGAALSSACSCLLPIPQSTTTTTTTVDAATCTTVTTCGTVTVSVTATTTSTCTITTVPTVSVTSTVTSTSTTVTTTSTGILAFATFLIEVQGGSNNGHFFGAATDGTFRIADTRSQDRATEFSISNTGPANQGLLVVASGNHYGYNLYEDTSKYLDGFLDYVYINSSANGHIPNHQYARPIYCNVIQPQGVPSCPLMCTGVAGATSYDCAGDWHLGPTPSATYNPQCQGSVFQPYVVGPR